MKPQLIVFGEDWGGLPSSTQHIIKVMATQYEVTWVNSLGLRTPKVNWHDAKRVFNKLGRMCRQLLSTQAPREVQKQTVDVITNNSFNVVEPQYLPFLGSSLARKINRFLLYRLLKRNVRASGHSARPVIWISLPNAVDALYYIHNTGLVDPVILYYCCDDFSSLAGVDHDAVSRFEAELAQQAGLIVATSDKLVDKFPSGKTHLVPHGVDTRLFYTPCDKAADLPQGKPVAGFYGSIASWIDLALMYDLARLMTDWNFVFVGAVKVDVTCLQSLENVYFLGEKPHTSLPGYSQHWQVSLLPFTLNEQIVASNPLKLREYMATGKPIVSVDFPQAQQYSRFVKITSGVDGFARAIRATQSETAEFGCLRQKTVANESWQSVAGKINGLIQAV
ncbi:MAG: glycosyltransferase [Algicola sp.]|nr:glycosyltransferase [Algicola sp.]